MFRTFTLETKLLGSVGSLIHLKVGFSMSLKEKLEDILSACGKPVTELSPREKALRVHDYVRDGIQFGFNKNFDKSSCQETISAGHGHCNPKGRLFVALLKEAEITARQHFVNIPNFVLRDAIPTFDTMSEIITHSYTEVNFTDDKDNNWIKVDSYVVDKPMFENSIKRLEEAVKEGKINPSIPGEGGFGIRIGGTCTWNGQSDSFSQFDPKTSCHDFVDDNGVPLPEEDVYQSPEYKHGSAQRIIYWSSLLSFGAANSYFNRDAESIRSGTKVSNT